MRESFGRREELRERKEKKERFPGDNGGGVTPVSIPNTEVKSSCADGTAYSFRGRVGHCQDIGEEREEKFLSFFFIKYIFLSVDKKGAINYAKKCLDVI